MRKPLKTRAEEASQTPSGSLRMTPNLCKSKSTSHGLNGTAASTVQLWATGHPTGAQSINQDSTEHRIASKHKRQTWRELLLRIAAG